MATTTQNPLRILQPADQGEFISARSGSIQFWQGLSLLYLLLAAIAWATWGTTADALIDFGRELYLPWQIAEGKVLYRDVAYFNGPISPWFNALLFQIFGTSILTLFVANVCILAAIVTMMYVQLARRFSVLAATVACLIMIVVSGTAKVNYNYLTPYSHEMTHGVFLCLAILCLISRFDGNFQWVRWSIAGLCFGLVFLGKPELFVAATAMIMCSLVLRGWTRQTSFRELLRQATLLAIGFLLPVAVCFFILKQQLGGQMAWQSLLGGWPHIFGSDVTQLLFYRRISGLVDPGPNLMRAFSACLAIGSLLLGLYLLEKNFSKYRWWNAGAILLVLFSIHLGGYRVIVLHAAAFSVIAGLLLVATIYMAMKQPGDFNRYHLLACWSSLGLLLMAKMMLRPSFGFYGFVLAMPVLVLSVAMAIDWLPTLLFPRTSGRRFRQALVILLVVQMIVSFAGTLNGARRRGTVIGSGVDRMHSTEDRGKYLKQASDLLRTEMQPGQTLLVLPEGISMNYLLRRESPTPYVNFMQPELVMYGETNMLQSLANNPSDYILLVSRQLPDYGLDHFGQPGYGDQIMNWVEDHYVLEKQLGADPSHGDQFGVQILKLRR